MSVAVTIDAGAALPSAAVATGTDLRLHSLRGRLHMRLAHKRRYLKAAAVHDAWMHSIQERCVVAVPLVRPALTG